nr:hypothetical protein [Tanacetum cinerariifolium]
VERELAISKDSVSKTVRWISYGPRATIVKYKAYNINEYTFRMKSNDGIVYQNSGVSVEALDLHISKEVTTTRKRDKASHQVSSCCSSNVTPTPVLDEIIALSGETEIPKVMKIFFEQQIFEEEAFTKYIRHKIADVKASLTRVRTTICKMEIKSDKDAWKDAIDCFKETKDRLELKLSHLIQLADAKFDGVKELQVHYAIMDLCE